MQVGSTNGNLFAVDANTLEYLYEVPLKGYPQGSILISTSYLAETGKLYCYATYNSQPGGMTLIKIDPNGTTVDSIELEEIYDAEKYPQYCLISPICGPDGTLYYRNDSATLIALTTNNAYLTDLTASVGTFTKEFAPGPPRRCRCCRRLLRQYLRKCFPWPASFGRRSVSAMVCYRACPAG